MSSESLGDILFGIPAHSMPVAHQSTPTMFTARRTKQAFIDGFWSIFYEFINILLFSFCVTLTVTVTSDFNMFAMTVPVFFFLYSFVISTAYRHLLNSFLSPLAMPLLHYYEKRLGSLLGGTQWLVVILRRFGAKIGEDVIIEDMNCIEDAHFTTIDSHVRLSSTSRIQVGTILLHCQA